MPRISLALLVLLMLVIDPTLALARGGGGTGGMGGMGGTGGMGGGVGTGATGTGASSAGRGAGESTPVHAEQRAASPAATARADEQLTSDAVKDPLRVGTRHPQSTLLQRPGRQ
jgi:hypothetical protein